LPFLVLDDDVPITTKAAIDFVSSSDYVNGELITDRCAMPPPTSNCGAAYRLVSPLTSGCQAISLSYQ